MSINDPLLILLVLVGLFVAYELAAIYLPLVPAHDLVVRQAQPEAVPPDLRAVPARRRGRHHLVALPHSLRHDHPMKAIAAFILGALSVAVIVLTIHDQQNIAALKRQHQRIKALEALNEKSERLGLRYSDLLGTRRGR